MKKILIVCGPTGVGKTSLALRLAKKFNGEIISADSRQVYRGMDIATGKDIAGGVWRTVRRGKEKESEGYWEVEGVPIHLLDVVNPNQEFSVSGYYRLAWKKIKDIWQTGKSRPKVEDPRREASGLPLLVGGTGFYIKAVVDGIPTKDIPPNPTLRKSLEGKNPKELLEQLEALDSFRACAMNVSDRKNPRRLVRAIEVACWQQENRFWIPPKHEVPDALFIGLTAPNKVLYQKIDKRIDEWVKEGVEEEIRRLLGKYQWDSSVLRETLGYKEWRPYFEGQAAPEETVKRWKNNEHAYARRQKTWFKKDKRVNWFDISQGGWENKIEKLVSSWYTKT